MTHAFSREDTLRWLAALVASLAFGAAHAQGQQNPTCNLSFTHERCSYQTGIAAGLTRQGIVCLPASTQNAPVVLAFHGYGGCAFEMAVKSAVHDAWPQALVIYPDALPGTPTTNDPSGSETGWQLYPGNQDDRDVALVDVVLNYLPAAYGTDPSRVYALGHSNGSRFVGVLWATRAQSFRAFAFSAAQPGDLFTLYPNSMPARPVAMIMGRTDCQVPFNQSLGCPTPVAKPENYQEASINLARRVLGIPEGATPVGLQSRTGTAGKEMGLYVHDGGHVWLTDATGQIVAFLQRN